IPGRFETVQQKPKIILDGGHNPDGISAFVETVQKLYPNAPKLIVNGFLKDKSYEIAVQTAYSQKQLVYYHAAGKSAARTFTG
ncbi:hypothetical protein LOB20_09675, partial [Lactobacillus delbrueckii subsp. lactis]|nr:hypothetical protein [Lactobacillus delbrueckii subsp. lactis]